MPSHTSRDTLISMASEGDVEFRNLRIKDLACQPAKPNLAIGWSENLLTIAGPQVPGGSVAVNYIEAYCRDGSHKRDWSETTIPHKTELVSANREKTYIQLRDRLEEGVIVDHCICGERFGPAHAARSSHGSNCWYALASSRIVSTQHPHSAPTMPPKKTA